jgi:hypothetical protein
MKPLLVASYYGLSTGVTPDIVFGDVNTNLTKHTSEKSLLSRNQHLRYQIQSTMSTTDDFPASLVRCGFAKVAAKAIIAEGPTSITNLAGMWMSYRNKEVWRASRSLRILAEGCG